MIIFLLILLLVLLLRSVKGSSKYGVITIMEVEMSGIVKHVGQCALPWNHAWNKLVITHADLVFACLSLSIVSGFNNVEFPARSQTLPT